MGKFKKEEFYNGFFLISSGKFILIGKDAVDAEITNSKAK